MDRVSHSENDKCMENFIDLVRYVKSPIHMILCIGKEGIFVEYFPRERRIMLGHNRRSIKLPKNEFSTLLLYLDTLYDNVEEFVLGNYDDSGICIDVGYVERESNIYILDFSMQIFLFFQYFFNFIHFFHCSLISIFIAHIQFFKIQKSCFICFNS